MRVTWIAWGLWASVGSAWASDGGVRTPYTTGDEGQQEIVARCLDAWETHPFDRVGVQRFRVIRPKVRVMGLGSSEVRDDTVSGEPTLVLLEPSVNVMTKTTYELLDPNGWYCFDAAVTVMGKAVIQLGCQSHLASGRDGATVIAVDDQSSGTVTVLGSTRVRRLECPAKAMESGAPDSQESRGG